MTKKTELSQLIKEMSPTLNEGEYVFVSVQDATKISRTDTICEFKEKEGVTIVLNREKADELHLNYDFIARWITLKVHSSLEAVGLTAAFSEALAKQNISCNVIAGYYHDHIFIHKKDANKAIHILDTLSKNYNQE